MWRHFFNEDIQVANRCIKRCSTLSAGKCMSKPQYSITSYPLAWLDSERGATVSAEEDAEKLESSYVDGENIKHHSRFAKQLVVPQKVKHRSAIWPSNSIFKCILKWNENTFAEIHAHECSQWHYSYSQKVETIQLSIKWQTDVIYPHNGVLFSHKKINEVTMHATTKIGNLR